MAREVVTNIWCDQCLEDEDERYSPARELPPIVLGNAKPRILALCERHEKELYEPFRQLVMEVGVVASPGSPAATRMPGTAPGSGVYFCPVPTCPKHTHPLKHEQSLRNHARNIHESTVSKLREEFGEPGGEHPGGGAPDDALFADALPDEEEGPPGGVAVAACEDCDVVYEWPKAKRPTQALGVHRAKVHGVPGKTRQGGK